jgi:hypothetical protein
MTILSMCGEPQVLAKPLTPPRYISPFFSDVSEISG